MDSRLYEKEREEMLLMEGLVKSINNFRYLKTRVEATCGNFDLKSKPHRILSKTATSLGYVLHWLATMQYSTAKELTGYEQQSLGHYTNKAATRDGFHTVDNVSTPHALYESYIKAFTGVEKEIRSNQKAIDRTLPCNELVGYLYDSLQDAGEALEEIL